MDDEGYEELKNDCWVASQTPKSLKMGMTDSRGIDMFYSIPKSQLKLVAGNIYVKTWIIEQNNLWRLVK